LTQISKEFDPACCALIDKGQLIIIKSPPAIESSRDGAGLIIQDIRPTLSKRYLIGPRARNGLFGAAKLAACFRASPGRTRPNGTFNILDTA